MAIVDPPDHAHRAYLVVSYPAAPAAPAPIELTGRASFTIGRAASNDLRLDDASVARAHCRIVHRDGAYLLQDLQSAGGFTLETPGYSHRGSGWHFLLDGDTLQLGSIRVRFTRHPPRAPLEAHLQRGHFAHALDLLRQTPLPSLDAGLLRLLANLLVHQRAFDEATAVLDRLHELEPQHHQPLAEYRACLRAERALRARPTSPTSPAERRSLLPPSAVPPHRDAHRIPGASTPYAGHPPRAFDDLRDLDDLADATIPCFLDGHVYDVPFAHLLSLDLTRGRSALLPPESPDSTSTYALTPYADPSEPTPERLAARNRRWFPAAILWLPAELVTLDHRAHHVFLPLLSAAHRPGAPTTPAPDEPPEGLDRGERHLRIAYSDGITHTARLSRLHRLTFAPWIP